MENDVIEGFELACKTCFIIFWICRRCYRGHRYCSKSCSHVGRRTSQRIARQKHQRSAEGRADHRDRQQAYRDRLKERTGKSDPVTDQCFDASQTSVQVSIELKSTTPDVCICCARSRFHDGGIDAKEDQVRP